MYKGKKDLERRMQLQAAKNEVIEQMVQEKATRMKALHEVFHNNLAKYAAQYKAEINKDPNFRDNFNQLCQNLGVDPMISQKTIFSNLGFGDFYNELAVKLLKILDITARKKQENGGMMKITDITNEFQNKYNQQISKKDVQEAMKTVSELGGCQLVNNEYVSISNLSVSEDFNSVIEVAEKFGHVSLKLMEQQKGWKKQKFDIVIDPLRKEGIVWVDKKTAGGEPHYYFPSMLNTFIERKAEYIKYLI